jgi:hypothetical protein
LSFLGQSEQDGKQGAKLFAEQSAAGELTRGKVGVDVDVDIVYRKIHVDIGQRIHSNRKHGGK